MLPGRQVGRAKALEAGRVPWPKTSQHFVAATDPLPLQASQVERARWLLAIGKNAKILVRLDRQWTLAGLERRDVAEPATEKSIHRLAARPVKIVPGFDL